MVCMQNKIVVFLGFNNPLTYKRGVENVIYFQARAANKQCFYLFLGPKNTAFKWRDITCISVKKNLFTFITINRVINKLKKKYSAVPLIHGHSYLLSAAVFRKIDVFTVHDGLFYIKKTLQSKLLPVFTFIEKYVYYKSKKVHFVSAYSKLQSLYKGDKDIVIYNTSINEAQREPVNNIALKQQKTIFIVRSIEERVGFDLVIEFASYLQQKYNGEYIIEVAGKGPLLEHYIQLTKSKNIQCLLFWGYIDDGTLFEKYNSCYMVLVPALYGEGFGLPIIEAYCINKPVLASAVCAIPEVIINKAHLFNNNISSLINCFESFTAEQPGKYKYAEYYNENFSNKVIMDKYSALLYNN